MNSCKYRKIKKIMSYVIRFPNFVITNGRKTACFIPFSSRKLFKVAGTQKVPNCNSTSSFATCYYSTFSNSRHFQCTERNLTVTSPTLNLVSYLSTSGNEDKFQVIITNPIDNTSSTSEISLNSSETIVGNSFLPSTETLTDSASEITDIAATSTNLVSIIDVVEPSLSSLGLASWTPVGIVQQCLEFFHVSMHMPWWMAIATCTIIARTLLIPLLIKTQRNALNMSNYMPQLQYLQAKFGEARRTGNSMEASRYASELMLYMKQHNLSPMKNALLPLLQAPVFVSFFMGLRSMAKLPVESMKTGGILWTTDLTIPDPYYVMPLVACSTLYIVLKMGAESGVKMENMKLAKYVLSALPIIIFPFCMNFPSAILYYWCTTNLCTLAFVSVMRIKPVRAYLKLPTQQVINPKFVPKKKGFIQGIKEGFEDQKVLAAVEERRKMDIVRFQKAGTGPIPRTYSYDPTKPRPANAAAAANCKTQTMEHKT